MPKKEKQVVNPVEETIGAGAPVEEITETKTAAVTPAKPKTTSRKNKSDSTKKTTKTSKAPKETKETIKEIVKVIVPEVFIQFAGTELDAHSIIEQIKADWFNAGNNENTIESIKVYIKPEENAAYYVINETETGKIDL